MKTRERDDAVTGSGASAEQYLSPDEVCALVPGMTRSLLAQLRYLGKGGPAFLKPTPRTVVYKRSSVVAWLEASERTITRADSRSDA